MKTELLIIGGGASGICAGIQAARMGIKTLVVEESSMAGGMFLAAGVTAFDGNKYAVGGGLFGEFRKKIEDHYGGPEKTFTGWISLTCFEPHTGKQALDELIASAGDNLTIWYNTKLVSVIKDANNIKGAVFSRGENNENSPLTTHHSPLHEVLADITIEATEYAGQFDAELIECFGEFFSTFGGSRRTVWCVKLNGRYTEFFDDFELYT